MPHIQMWFLFNSTRYLVFASTYQRDSKDVLITCLWFTQIVVRHIRELAVTHVRQDLIYSGQESFGHRGEVRFAVSVSNTIKETMVSSKVFEGTVPL